jgi:hypothetical protein
MLVEGSSDTHFVSLGLVASSMTVLLGWDETSVDLDPLAVSSSLGQPCLLAWGRELHRRHLSLRSELPQSYSLSRVGEGTSLPEGTNRQPAKSASSVLG